MESHKRHGGMALLWQLDSILSSDPLIDEVGFVHPTQLASLHEGTPSSSDNTSGLAAADHGPSFWCGDHKLAISVQAQVPIYKAAIPAFLAARKSYVESHCSDAKALQQQLLAITRVLILVNPDHRSSWNARKRALKGASSEAVLAEIQLCSLVLSYDFKCEEAWAHRRWVILSMLKSLYWEELPQFILERELQLVEMVAERSRMNYRAWRHCCWLATLISCSQALGELQRQKKWAQCHVADNCSFHFRRCLLQKLLNERTHHETLLQDEMGWNEGLIKLYIGREALWMHRRFLFLCLSRDNTEKDNKHWTCDVGQQTLPLQEIEFAEACISMCGDEESEDSNRQVIYAATYKLWVLLKWKEVGFSGALGSEVWGRELGHVETLLRRKACHQMNLWRGIFGELITFT